MTLNKIQFVFIIVILITGCTKTEYLDNPPQLEVTVLSSDFERIRNAQVLLFDSLEDLQNEQNERNTSLTDADGKAFFEKLETRIYYINIIYGEYNHKVYETHLNEPLLPNVLTRITLTINFK